MTDEIEIPSNIEEIELVEQPTETEFLFRLKLPTRLMQLFGEFLQEKLGADYDVVRGEIDTGLCGGIPLYLTSFDEAEEFAKTVHEFFESKDEYFQFPEIFDLGGNCSYFTPSPQF